MATVTHYIYSHYDLKQREELQRATEQIPELEGVEPDPWQTESSFGGQRRLATAPQFVPAVVSYDEINIMMGLSQVIPEEVEERPNDEVSSWYKSLTRSNSALVADDTTLIASTSASSAPKTPFNISPVHVQSEATKPDKNDWFISRALRSVSSSGASTPAQTLADILARDPPPDSSTKSFAPPVFLHLGPSNRGYTMLEKSGWNEGEPLGPGVARRPRGSERTPPPNFKREKRKATYKQEQREFKLDPDGEISEVQNVDVIDLTLSDAEDETEDIKADPDVAELSMAPTSDTDIPSTHNPRALLTPLPTVLKSDRLGIGLKAKTVGPYKASKKRVTHNQAALAQHVRETEEMRRMKALVGRGSRGLARLAKAEAESRRRLLASLNDPF